MTEREKQTEELEKQLEKLTKKIDRFQPKETGDCKKLEAMCNEKARLVYLLNLARSGTVAKPNKEIFGVCL